VPQLLIGPLLRHVGTTNATVWVETDGPCDVTVLGTTERTWSAGGHHYALVQVEDLSPGEESAYEVHLDGERVWPEPDSRFPPSRIRTVDPDRPLRLIFGSCRYAEPSAVEDDAHFDADALNTYARQMLGRESSQWPDAVLLLGDQVYADETTEHTQEFIRSRRDITTAPGVEVADFEEYTHLYLESWTDPPLRWLLSNIPSSMIFDDHDIRDDWNTSWEWRRDMQATEWWQERVVGGLMSYWIYQHIGNLSPEALEKDELFQRIRRDGEGTVLLREFATAADKEADGHKGAQWSYRRDLGRTRVLVIDSRCGRMLDDGNRSMVSGAEMAWIEEQVAGEYDHLVIGTSLPWLLPRALHDLESWDERVAGGSRGRQLAKLGEKLRRAADLEHWAAFRQSFDWLAELLASVGRGDRGDRPPATICVLSGDVHHAYVAQAHYDDERIVTPIYQLTCSPIHNYVPRPMQIVFKVAWSRAAEKTMRFLLSRVSHVPKMIVDWTCEAGPFWGNELATLLIEGRTSRMQLERTKRSDGPHPDHLHPVAEMTLTAPVGEQAEAPRAAAS